VVVSLSDYNSEYIGGLYISTRHSERNYIALNRGDAVVHQGDLYHGVQLIESSAINTERWSWILWYRDSETCQDHSDEWYIKCATVDKNPACQYLLSTTINSYHEKLMWTEKAAEQGHGVSCVKLAKAYLKLIDSPLPLDPMKARDLYQRAIDSVEEPDGYYGLAAMISAMIRQMVTSDQALAVNFPPGHPLIIEMIRLLEKAAFRLHPFAMYHLGVAHSYGYGDSNGIPDEKLGGDWYAASGLPEAYHLRAEYEASIGNMQEAAQFSKRAEILGFGSPIRVYARKASGYGGTVLDINLFWPLLAGRQPRQW
jgi:TPR repeat protein